MPIEESHLVPTLKQNKAAAVIYSQVTAVPVALWNNAKTLQLMHDQTSCVYRTPSPVVERQHRCGGSVPKALAESADGGVSSCLRTVVKRDGKSHQSSQQQALARRGRRYSHAACLAVNKF